MDVDDFSCACSLILTTSNGVTAEKKKFTHCFLLTSACTGDRDVKVEELLGV